MTQRIADAFNWQFLIVVVALLFVGLVNLYSAVHVWEEGGALTLFWSQLVWVALGVGLMVVMTFLDYRVLKRLAPAFHIAVILLLVATVIFGTVVRGAKGWLKVGPVSLQPAEFAKISFIFLASRYFGNNPQPDGYGIAELWKPFLFMLVPFGLILLQGDMGSALFLILIFGSMALFAGIQRRTLITFAVLVLAAGAVTYTFGLKEYQRSRIESFLHPEADIRGSGYQLMQSKIAVGSGMVFGQGYLKGNINKLRYLPERHTDFIFPVLAEEWGFAGSLVVLGLYASLLLIGVEIGAKARDRFGMFLGIGIVAMLFWQLTINLGGVLGLMPLTGVTLPLLSYGGSSVVATLMSLGVLLSISLRRFMF